jgi:hypothetical protein
VLWRVSRFRTAGERGTMAPGEAGESWQFDLSPDLISYCEARQAEKGGHA